VDRRRPGVHIREPRPHAGSEGKSREVDAYDEV